MEQILVVISLTAIDQYLNVILIQVLEARAHTPLVRGAHNHEVVVLKAYLAWLVVHVDCRGLPDFKKFFCLKLID